MGVRSASLYRLSSVGSYPSFWQNSQSVEKDILSVASHCLMHVLPLVLGEHDGRLCRDHSLSDTAMIPDVVLSWGSSFQQLYKWNLQD